MKTVYLIAFDFMALANKSLELGMLNLVRRQSETFA